MIILHAGYQFLSPEGLGIFMSLLNSPSSSWLEFAETFFVAEEDRRRNSFLARNSIHFSGATELPTILSRIAQSAIPEIADGCLILLRSETGEWENTTVVHRYEEEETEFQALRKLPKTLTGAFQWVSDLRSLSPDEIFVLSQHLPNLVSAVVTPLGKAETPFGFAVFFQTRSKRSFAEPELRLIHDLIAHGENMILHAKAAECLRQEVRAHEKFIAVASHELKTPVPSLKLQLDALRWNFRREQAALPAEKIESAFKTLDRAIHQLTQSIDMLFNLSEVRAGQIGLLKAPGDLARLTRETISRMDSLMKASGCDVFAEIPESLPAFFDARRIEQALINLLANAAKYAPRSRVEVRVVSVADQAKIEIRDIGPGIDPKHQSEIFEAIRRIADAPTTQGLGLGLFITQGVIHAHGGALALTSALGEGSNFTITIPLWQA